MRRNSRTRVKDVKVLRGAEIGSDHYLVLLKMSGNNMVERSKLVSKSVRIRAVRLNDGRVKLKQKMNNIGHREESIERGMVRV